LIKPAESCRGLRVLLVATYPPPFGGIATHLTTLIPGLKQRGAEDIAVLSFGDQDAVEKRDDFTLYRFDLKRAAKLLARPSSWPVAAATLRALGGRSLGAKVLLLETLKAVLCDLIARRHGSQVVSFYASEASLQLLPLARHWGPRRRTVLTVFGEVYSEPEFMQRHRALYAELFSHPHAVLSSSRHCASSFASIGIQRAIEPVYYGVRLNGVTSAALRSQFRRERGMADDDVVVLFVGRFSKEMGLDVLLRASPGLLAADPRIRIVIAGGKAELSREAVALAQQHDGRVVVIENLPFSQQEAVYSGGDMLVAPSFNQRACMGMAIKEAMAAALPVIAGVGGGVPEAVVDSETGFLIPLDASGAVDVEAFSQAVLRLAGDPQLRSRLGEAGRRRAESIFAYDVTNERMATIFMSAMKS
jgi:glycosyltransferase involved in cell wall biosynthesis